MSVGTANYHDCLALRPIVRELQASGKIIVAAFHNGGLPSWPAALPGVFGVRRDARSRLGSGEYAFAAGNGGLNAENRLVARYDAPLFTVGGEYVYTAAGNSFAAPVVTGHIASFLLERPDADFDGVLAYLQQNSRPVDVSEDGAREGLAAGKGASCPVMLFSEGDGALFADMVNMFRADGYKAEGFSDISDSDGTVPFRLYAKAGETVNSGILFALEQVYKPDAMLFCLDKSRLGDTIDYSIVDAYIRRRGGAFVVNYDDHSECGHCTVDSLFAGLVGYFN
jgi:hypothetical protein